MKIQLHNGIGLFLLLILFACSDAPEQPRPELDPEIQGLQEQLQEALEDRQKRWDARIKEIQAERRARAQAIWAKIDGRSEAAKAKRRARLARAIEQINND